MHLKLVVNSFPKSSETFLFNLVTALEQRGVKVTVSAVSASKDEVFFADKLTQWSGNIQYISLKPFNIYKVLTIFKLLLTNPLFFFQTFSFRHVRKSFLNFLNVALLRQGKPDIIHFSFSGLAITYLDVIGYLKKSSIKTIVSCRGTAEKVKPLLSPERGKELRELFSKIDRVHCVSIDMKNGLAAFGLQPEKAFVNYPSINLRDYKRKNKISQVVDREINIVTTGSLNFSKGYIFALQAMKIIKERQYKFRYHILGDGPDWAMITFSIHELGLSKEVRLYGKVSSLEVRDMLEQADVFLLSSIYEGVSNAALEAMTMEVPLVTTKAGGMPEVVTDRYNGRLVNCFSGLEIANAIEEIITSQELRSVIIKNARATVEKKFSLDDQIDIFMAQYQSLLPVTGNAV